MTYFPWSEKYLVNIPKIDEQHKHLVNLINELYEAMKAGKGKEVIGKTLSELMNYAITHFQTEEIFMKTYSYPELTTHQREHQEFTKKVVELHEQFQNNQATVTIQVAKFLKDWLNQHILGTDQKYAPYLRGKASTN
jgi:hemerythrin